MGWADIGQQYCPHRVIHPSVPYAARPEHSPLLTCGFLGQRATDRAGVCPRSTFCPSHVPIAWMR